MLGKNIKQVSKFIDLIWQGRGHFYRAFPTGRIPCCTAECLSKYDDDDKYSSWLIEDFFLQYL